MAHQVCNQILNQLRFSNLHFLLKETPHSVQIGIRKHFLDRASGQASSIHESFKSDAKIQDQNSHLFKENEHLKDKIKELEVYNNSSREINEILEEKVAKIEESALKAYEEQKMKVIGMIIIYLLPRFWAICRDF